MYACSGNGTYLVKAGGGSISYSTNSGSSWTRVNRAGCRCLVRNGCFCSDCTRLVAAVTNGLLYASAVKHGYVVDDPRATTNQALCSALWINVPGRKQNCRNRQHNRQ